MEFIGTPMDSIFNSKETDKGGKLGVVHILRRQNFGFFYPPSLLVDNLFSKAYLVK